MEDRQETVIAADQQPKPAMADATLPGLTDPANIVPSTNGRQPQQPPEIRYAEGISPAYFNFVGFCPSPEELTLELGLNRNSPGMRPVPIVVHQICTMNYFTAKRLMHALGIALEQHEKVFGNVEVEVTKRIQGRMDLTSD